MDASSLRSRLLQEGLTDLLPRTYYGLSADPLDEIIEVLLAVRAGGVPSGSADADENAELEELREALRSLEAEARSEDTDGNRALSAIDLARRLTKLTYPDNLPDESPELLSVRVPWKTFGEHTFMTFAHGFQWCSRCGTLRRLNEKSRHFQVGIGEVDTLPPCRSLHPDHVVQTGTPAP